MRFDFWRGIIAGGLLGIMAAILISPEIKRKQHNLIGSVNSRRARRNAGQILKGVKRTIREVTR
jgi:gas vesicle protein